MARMLLYRSPFILLAAVPVILFLAGTMISSAATTPSSGDSSTPPSLPPPPGRSGDAAENSNEHRLVILADFNDKLTQPSELSLAKYMGLRYAPSVDEAINMYLHYMETEGRHEKIVTPDQLPLKHRIIRKGTMHTMEHDSERLTLRLDKDSLITSAKMG